jgi:hypothetical protein
MVCQGQIFTALKKELEAMATATERLGSPFERYAWTAFVLVGVLLLLIGAGDLASAGSNGLLQEDALNELFIGILGIVVAAGGLRRGDRWAWYTMATWPVWIVAQGIGAWSRGKEGQAISAVVFLVIVAAALALTYRRSFRPHA